MTIWIDIFHVAQFNFYVSLIKQLYDKGDKVVITVLDRGRLLKIVQTEITKIGCTIEVYPLGKHKMSKWSALIDVNLLRLISLTSWASKRKIDIAFSNGSHIGIIGRIYGFPTYEFGDDPNTFDFYLKVWFATKAHLCIVDKQFAKNNKRGNDSRIVITHNLKEWSYLSPKVFVPNIQVLEQYGVKPKEYIFLREVSVGTVNYTGQESGAVLGIKDMIPKHFKGLFSLEEKNRRSEYPQDWILLQEPLEDIHSLIYYSAGLVSSGDSMAREAALLGVPSYYLGIRNYMPANAAAAKVASLQNRLTMPFEQWVSSLTTDVELAERKQYELREKINTEFIDINAYMMQLVEEVAQNKKQK